MCNRILLGLTVISFVFIAVGCSKTATIRTDGVTYESAIISSDSNMISVKNHRGSITQIPRSEVRDIDHPGNVHMVVGYSIALLATPSVLSGVALVLDDDPYSPLVGGLILFSSVPVLIAGLWTGIWGHVTWTESTRKIDTISDVPKMQRLVVAPQVYVKDGASFPGLQLSASF